MQDIINEFSVLVMFGIKLFIAVATIVVIFEWLKQPHEQKGD